MSETPAQAGHTEPLPVTRPSPSNEPERRADFSVFYLTEKRYLTAFLMYAGATVWEADDLAHEILFKLLPDRWMTMEHPRAYMRKAAIRAYLRQRERTREIPTDELPDLPGGISPVASVELSEQTQAIVDAILHLPPTQRSVMAFVMSGSDAREIAEALNMTLGAVSTNICRGRARLKTTLGLVKGEKDA
ncbi:RNA polymerase sigma factor [Streptomyces galilaeus]|uniref:RNA polymerase sigma factor n=1 Tax=Streptomyces galilaeus TaxID=33899 RepID=UPI0038F65942